MQVRDPLAQLLGATDTGLIEYRYEDAVRLAGHSCPTVAGAFLAGRAALAALYPGGPAERGAIAVHMPAPATHGTVGVVAQIFTLLTGAAGDGGFRGIGGRFARNGLLSFATSATSEENTVCVTRVDTAAAVAVAFHVDAVPVTANLHELMALVMQNRADAEQQAAFGAAWQDRVRRMLTEHADDPAVIRVTDRMLETDNA
nr:hypothetical protein [Salinisphaera sp. LB1]